jgi:hypothetical protein
VNSHIPNPLHSVSTGILQPLLQNSSFVLVPAFFFPSVLRKSLMEGLSGHMWHKDCSRIRHQSIGRHFKGLKYPEFSICIVQLSWPESWLISLKAPAFHAIDCFQLDVLFLWFKTYSFYLCKKQQTPKLHLYLIRETYKMAINI